MRSLVALGRAWEAHNHTEVALLYTLKRDVEPLLSLVWHVLLRVCSGAVILASVYAEDREVACVAWPHPVVGVATKLTDRGWRSADKADVGIYLVGEGKELVATEERRDDNLHTRVLGLELGDYSLLVCRDSCLVLLLRGCRWDVTYDIGRNVEDVAHEAY